MKIFEEGEPSMCEYDKLTPGDRFIYYNKSGRGWMLIKISSDWCARVSHFGHFSPCRVVFSRSILMTRNLFFETYHDLLCYVNDQDMIEKGEIKK